MKCSIIRDLLPLYCDKLTSEDSNEEIEKHLRECEECNNIYESMNNKEDEIKADRKDIKPLKKIKKRITLRVIAAIFGTLAVLSAVFVFVFVGVIPISSDKLHYTVTEAYEIKTYELKTGPNADGEYFTEYRDENMDNFYPIPEGVEVKNKKYLQINFTVDHKYVMSRSSMDFDDLLLEDGIHHDRIIHDHKRLYHVSKLPFDNRGEGSNVIHERYAVKEGDTLTIHCRDKDIELDLWQLYLDNVEK
ncbi:zf-HC2 domain-containing protein [Ruminococcus flavefaciens]|uniref:zf-HC2 domain-containing protein n=1 Tax=Ruminococcus flavefaciens TaxID=1265 RepID=UPI0006883E77|nr:zf-HC2 domain-containing protein [Ruminococcus flavefaciens]